MGAQVSDNSSAISRDELAALAYDLKMRGYSHAQIAKALSAHYTGKMSEPTKGWAVGLLRYHARAVAAEYGVREYTLRGDEPIAASIPVLDGALELDWPRCVVIGDVHLPTTDFAFAETMLEIAARQGIKRLLIGGDLLNVDAYSRFAHMIPPPTFAEEHAVAVRFVERLQAYFDEIVWMMGNHEARLLKANNGNITAGMLGSMISAARGKMRTTPYAYATVRSGNAVWRVTHQRSYSRIPGRVANRLAMKHECNVISMHQHHISVQMSENGRWVCIDGGGLFDDRKMPYVRLVDSTMPRMARGFVLLLDGTAHLITPYPAMTDLSRWLAPRKEQIARNT